MTDKTKEDTAEPRWTLDELVAKAAVALSLEGVDQSSARVTSVPSARTIRYYATHGLMDPPSSHRGRTALYDERHLLQIVAIKRLQAEGASLTEVQARLLNASDAELAELADLPEPTSARGRRRGGRREGAFWAERPAEPATPTAAAAMSPIVGVVLGEGVRLTVEGGAIALTAADLRAISAAAAPLLSVLRARGLMDKGEGEGQ